MRDIRSDLQERIEAIEDSIASLEDRLAKLEADKGAIQTLLDAENRRWHQTSGFVRRVPDYLIATRSKPESSRDGLRLTDYVLKLLAHGEQLSLEELRDKALADGYLIDAASPGRSMQGTLIGLKKRKMIDKLKNGKWAVPKTSAQTVSSQSTVRQIRQMPDLDGR